METNLCNTDDYCDQSDNDDYYNSADDTYGGDVDEDDAESIDDSSKINDIGFEDDCGVYDMEDVDDKDYDINEHNINMDKIKFEDFTFVSHAESTSNTETCVLSRDFSRNVILENAKPGTWMYNKILYSTPMMASSILTKYLNVLSVNTVYMSPNNVVDFTFYSKKK